MSSISERIKYFNRERDNTLQELKYQALSENVFRFFRGTCHIFYEDLSKQSLNLSSPSTWICGDLHLENFGSFKGDNRLVYFDINDFDEAVLAPTHWELLRIVSSIYVALTPLEIKLANADKLAHSFLEKYADTLIKGKALYIERLTATPIIADFLEQASLRKHREVIDKHTDKKSGEMRITLKPNRYSPIDSSLKTALMDFMKNWLQHDGDVLKNYKVIDCAFRIAGTGGLGMKRYGFLLKAKNDEGSKYMLLDMKQAKASATAAFVNTAQPSWQSDSHRIIELQKRMQNCPPALLSTAVFNNEDYIIKELQPQKDGINFKLLSERFSDMSDVIENMALLTASAQLRSSGRQGSAIADELIDFGNDKSWRNAIVEYACSYAERMKGYFEEFVVEMKS